MEPTSEDVYTYTFLFQHDDGFDTTVYKARSFDLEDVVSDFVSFLYDDRVGFKNDISFTIHDGSRGDITVKCKAPREE
jgi:hypothetical protein